MRTFTIPFLGTRISVRDKDESVLEFMPELRGKVFRDISSPRSFGSVHTPRDLDLGVLSRRVVTNAGVAFLCTDWNDGTKDITNFNAHGHGTGATAEAISDTALGTESGTRAAGVKTLPTANQIRTVATIAVTSTLSITEHGLFDSTTPAGSTLWDRSVFSAINVNNGDSIQYTYTLTVNAGG